MIHNTPSTPSAPAQKSETYVFLAPPLTESFELTLARASDLKATGQRISIVYCAGTVSGCVGNPLKVRRVCDHCGSVRAKALGELFEDHELLRLDDFYRQPLTTSVGEELRQSVRSTILTFFRVDTMRLRAWSPRAGVVRTMARNLEEHSRFVLSAARRLLAEKAPGRIEFFNGRLVPSAMLMKAAKELDISFSVIEVSGQKKTFFIADNASVHDIDYLKGRLLKYRGYVADPNDLAREFFEKRRRGERTNDRAYVASQQVGLFDASLRAAKIVSVFLSSTDEYEIFGDLWFTEASREPQNFVKELRRQLPDEYRIVVRMHPNQKGDRTGKAALIAGALKTVEGVMLIEPAAPYSTYELLDLSDYVVTFGSTVGVEATYWGKPSILAGRAVWEDAGVAWKVDSAKEAAILINGGVDPCSKLGASYVGAYYMDRQDETYSLSWSGDRRAYGFAVNGRSYLREKRRSPFYHLSRLVEKALRA